MTDSARQGATSCAPGSDVTLISYSRMVGDCVAVADKLAKEKIRVEVIDLRTIAPLDAETILHSVAQTRRAVIVHEAVKPFGVGAEIAAQINEALFGQLAAPRRTGGRQFLPRCRFPSCWRLLYAPSQAQIEAAVRRTLDNSSMHATKGSK